MRVNTKRQPIDDMQITEIDVNLLDPHPENREVKNTECESLSASIAARGVQDPLLVRTHPVSAGRYQIVSGHRRAVASRMAGAETVPCIIRDDMSDMEALEMVIVANIERKDLDAEEEARAVRALVDAGMTADDIIDRIHRSRQWVQMRLALGDLPQPMRKAVAEKKVALEVVADLMRVPEGQREEAVEVVLKPTFQELPLTTAQAKKVLEDQFIKPAELRAQWEAGMAKRLAGWKKALAPAGKMAGHAVSLVPVGYDAPLPGGDLRNALEAVTMETAIAMDPAADAPEGVTFGALAARAGHPVFIVPAQRVKWLDAGTPVGDTPPSVALVDANAIEEFERSVAAGQVPAVDAAWLVDRHAATTKAEDFETRRVAREERAKYLRGLIWDYLADYDLANAVKCTTKFAAMVVGGEMACPRQMVEVLGFKLPEDGLEDDEELHEWMARCMERSNWSLVQYMFMAIIADGMWIESYMVRGDGGLDPVTAERLAKWLAVLPDAEEHEGLADLRAAISMSVAESEEVGG